ncbi:MAG: diphthine synthase [Candidatus Woesearchaeota archaeon]|jgi:diphthine synthase|nr:diphthine synthase [Candidatus Woesearchaeota archaeon]
MLHLIGIGAKKEHINPEMLEAIKKSEKVFLEYYTSFYQTTFEDLSKYLGKELTIADRDLIESQIEEQILEPAKKTDIALLILGDPLIATTHTDLLLRAKDMNIKTKVYNNVSIGNYITRTGLQFYKFGKITSIPFFSEKFMPRTPYLVFIDNHRIGAHSLFLLDLNPSNDIAYKGHDKYLEANKALQFLLDIPKLMLENEEIEEKESQVIDEIDDAIICSRLGFEDEIILYGTIKELIEYDKKEILKEPLCIIIPGDMHEMEEEFLKQFKI